MFIGKLNTCADITYTLIRRETGLSPAIKQDGNPFLGEALVVSWMEMMEDTLIMEVDLGAEYFVNDIVFTFGGSNKPCGITIRDDAGTRVLARFLGETGQNIAASEAVLTVAEDVRRFRVEFDMNFTTLHLQGVTLYGADADALPVYPTPVSMQKSEGMLPAEALAAWTADSKDGEAAAAIFAEKLAEMLPVDPKQSENAALCFHQDADIPANGYRLTVTTDGAEIAASDLRGAIMGAETLLKLATADGVPCVKIEDAPRMPLRGVHLYLPAAKEMEFARRLIKYILSPLGYNAVIIEVAGMLRFDSHPEINEAVQHALAKAKAGEWPAFPHGSVAGGTIVEKADAAAFADYIRSYGMDVIPEVQSLSHVQFLTIAHPELGERAEDDADKKVDELSADVPPSVFYAHSYCPSMEKSYEITFDLIDEIVETFRPTKYVHMGHDEVYQIGICPRCKGKDPAKLLAYDINRYYDYLKAKGLTMMIWSDMLQPVTTYKTSAAIDMIPKDIVMLDFIWYFHMDKDIETNLLEKGFPTVFGNMYSSHFPRYESRAVRPGVIGAEVSCWVSTCEASLSREGKLYDFIYSGEMLWSDTYTNRLRWAYDRKIRAMIPGLRAAIRGKVLPTGRETVLYENPVTFPDAKPSNVALSVGRTCDTLVFTHTATDKLTRITWVPNTAIASYEITYEDGSAVSVPVTYGGNIGHWARRQNQPFTSGYYRHNGYTSTWETDSEESKTADGTPVSLYRLTWYNPAPEKAIRSVCLIPAGGVNTHVILTKLTAHDIK